MIWLQTCGDQEAECGSFDKNGPHGLTASVTVRSCGLGRGVSLGLGFEVSEAEARPSVIPFLLIQMWDSRLIRQHRVCLCTAVLPATRIMD